jgi:hypothetical protein
LKPLLPLNSSIVERTYRMDFKKGEVGNLVKKETTFKPLFVWQFVVAILQPIHDNVMDQSEGR